MERKNNDHQLYEAFITETLNNKFIEIINKHLTKISSKVLSVIYIASTNDQKTSRHITRCLDTCWLNGNSPVVKISVIDTALPEHRKKDTSHSFIEFINVHYAGKVHPNDNPWNRLGSSQTYLFCKK